MAFIPQPYGPDGESMVAEIPWTLPSAIYSGSLDGSDFEVFPEQSSWLPRSGEEWKSLISKTDQHFAAFLQIWLLSGLLNFIFQRPINIADLIPEEHEARGKGKIPADQVLTPEMLIPLVEQLNALPGSHEEVLRRRRCWWKVKRIHSKLDTNGEGGYIRYLSDEERAFQYTLESWITEFDFHDPRPNFDRVLLDILLVFFESVLWQKRASDSTPTPSGSFSEITKLKPIATNQRSFEFLVNITGQFPSTVYRLYSRLESPAYFYFINMRAWQGKNVEHRTCPIRQCKLTSIEEGHYHRRHFDCCCGEICEDLVASQSDLLAILHDGGLPLIRLCDEKEKTQIVYTSSTEK
ncbi:hypothetical protein C7974DRAFT_376986 [Boeremia exigua]|uniref:uncharacterized protein n=1 Tax=Boeremia exigua TaxID=749465 RepID=UPI001E8D690A|nr:uncharacterized protein C7974DRAFT_376986 [Boeremia exigua]KAH6625478.1 hypothetical protein C7974DRAFT_376986 [Boeremia exigua]